MAFTDNQRLFAYYVTATVESGCDYSGVYLVDAITLGITQWYGQHAWRLLDKVRADATDAYAKLNDRLKGLCEGGMKSWGYWTNVYITQADANAWAEAAKLDSCKKVQDELFMADCFGTEAMSNGDATYRQVLATWGCNIDSTPVKSWIFWMTIYHQSPASAQRGIGAIGAGASIEAIRDWALSYRVTSPYKNRLNTVYRLLNEWDASSAPPNFGYVSDFTDGEDTTASTQATTLQSQVSYVQQWGNDIVIHGKVTESENLICHYTGKGIWVPKGGTLPSNPASGTEYSGDVPAASDQDPTDFPAMRQLWYDHANEWSYSNGGGRLSPTSSGYSDCSACIWWAQHMATNGKYDWMGTYTGAMVANCPVVYESTDSSASIPRDQLRPGDLLLVAYRGNSEPDHVEWYMGNGVVWGAGRAPLPHHTTDNVETVFQNWSIPVTHIWVCRFLD